jgi:uncharacterized membrane protein YphA (DoxX/SURF4 family)
MNVAGRAVYHLCRLAFGGLFLYAGILKAVDVTAFAGTVAAYRILPYTGNYLLAAILPYIEIVSGILLVANRRVRPAALLLGGLTVCFMLALGTVLLRGIEVDCGCFGAAGQTSPTEALVRDAGLLVLAAAVYFLRGRAPR